MFDLIYEAFFYILIGQGIFFLLITLPTPHGIKGKIINFMNRSKTIQTIRKIHLFLCVIAVLFLLDSFKTQAKFHAQKVIAKAGDSMASGTKHLYLSYMGLKAQRNSYTTGMLIYVSLALNIYVWLLSYMYEKRQRFNPDKKQMKIQKS